MTDRIKFDGGGRRPAAKPVGKPTPSVPVFKKVTKVKAGAPKVGNRVAGGSTGRSPLPKLGVFKSTRPGPRPPVKP